MDHPKNRVVIGHSHHIIMYIILLFGLLVISIIILTSQSNIPFFPLQLSISNPSKPVKKKRKISYICSHLDQRIFRVRILYSEFTNSIYILNSFMQLHEQVNYYKDDLERALAGASTENKTVIITVVNKAYVEGDHNNKPMLDLFLDGFWHGEDTRELVNHLLIVSMDQTSYERCKFLHLHCYKLQTDGVDFAGEKLFMSQDFIKMMWRRTLFLGDVLKRGYNFIFTVCLCLTPHNFSLAIIFILCMNISYSTYFEEVKVLKKGKQLIN